MTDGSSETNIMSLNDHDDNETACDTSYALADPKDHRDKEKYEKV